LKTCTLSTACQHIYIIFYAISDILRAERYGRFEFRIISKVDAFLNPATTITYIRFPRVRFTFLSHRLYSVDGVAVG